VKVDAYVHKVKEVTSSRGTLVFFHGDYGFTGDLLTDAITCDRYAYEANVTVINVNYRLPTFPSDTLTKGVVDGYAALKWAIKNA